MKVLILGLALLAGDYEPLPPEQTESDAAYRFALARSLAEEGSIEQALDVWSDLVAKVADDPYVRVEYARFLTRIGRFAEAVRQAETALDLAPENADALKAAAEVYLSAKRIDEAYVDRAVASLERLSMLQPNDPQVLVDLGRVLLIDVNEPREAATIFARAVALQPASRMLQAYLVEALLRASQRSEAERSLQDFLQHDPEFLRGRLLLANQLSQRGEHRRAAGTLRGAPASQAGDRDLRWQLASELYRTGELEEGILILDGLLAEQPDTFKERTLRGMMLAALGRSDEAAEVFLDLHRERPDNLEIFRSLIRALEREGRRREAEELSRQAYRRVEAEEPESVAAWRFELLSHFARVEAWKKLTAEARLDAEDPASPLHVQGFFLYVEALRQSGRSEKALDLLTSADPKRLPSHRVRSKEAEILADLGRVAESETALAGLAGASDLPSLLAAAEVYQRQERYEDAVPILARALDQTEDSIRVRYWLGAAYERSGDREQAARVFGSLLELEPGYAPALNYLGYMWAEQGVRLEEAVELVDRAVAQEPDNGAYVDSLGWAHFQLGDYETALRLLERAARLLPDDGVIHDHLGDVYARVGRSEDAAAAYRRALELKVDNERQVRAKLEQLTDAR